jgi:tight adherence protein B
VTAAVVAALLLAIGVLAAWLGGLRPLHRRAGGATTCWRIPRPIEVRLRRAAPAVEPQRAWSLWLVAAVVAVVAGAVVGGPVLAALVAAVATAGPMAAESTARARNTRKAAARVPATLEATARALRGGASLPTALADAAASAGPIVGATLAEVATSTARGQPLVDALEAQRAHCDGVPGLPLALTALVMAAETGGPQAAALDGVAATLRQRLATQAEADALASQARMSAMVIALAPVGFALLMSAADRRNADFLLRTPLGAVLLAAGLALDALGAWWMTRLTRIGGPP